MAGGECGSGGKSGGAMNTNCRSAALLKEFGIYHRMGTKSEESDIGARLLYYCDLHPTKFKPCA